MDSYFFLFPEGSSFSFPVPFSSSPTCSSPSRFSLPLCLFVCFSLQHTRRPAHMACQDVCSGGFADPLPRLSHLRQLFSRSQGWLSIGRNIEKEAEEMEKRKEKKRKERERGRKKEGRVGLGFGDEGQSYFPLLHTFSPPPSSLSHPTSFSSMWRVPNAC